PRQWRHLAQSRRFCACGGFSCPRCPRLHRLVGPKDAGAQLPPQRPSRLFPALPCPRPRFHRPGRLPLHLTQGASPMTKSLNGPLRIGIGGPVGSGKTTLCEMLLKAMRDRYSMAVVTNAIEPREGALSRARVPAISADRTVGGETGGCPHTATREDASLKLAASDDLNRKFPE